ncbi:MAG: hypothetical protein QOF29_2042 [bacterium]
MSFLRTIVRDLVERRLWPVALLLVAALVAVPVVLGRGGDAAPVATPATTPAATPADASGAATTTAGDTAARAAISLDDSVPERRARAGALRNPFQGPAAPKSAGSQPASTSAGAPGSASASTGTGSSTSGGDPSASTPSSGSGSTGSGSGSSGSGTTTPTPSTTTKTPAKPKADDASDTFHVSLRFGVTGTQETIRDIARLTPLPSVKNPFFVYLGVLQDGKTAVFMVSSDAVPTGDGACRPSAAACETIELKAGDTEFFDLTAADGVVTQYQMDLVSIRKTEIQATAKAAAASARHSRAGAELLRDAAIRGVDGAAGSRSYRYVPERGILVRAKRAKAVRAAASALIPGAAEAVQLLPRTQQPGIPVWYSDAGNAQR